MYVLIVGILCLINREIKTTAVVSDDVICWEIYVRINEKFIELEDNIFIYCHSYSDSH